MIKSAVTISLVKEAEGGPFVFWHDLAAGCAKAAELGYGAVEVFAPNADAIRRTGAGVHVKTAGTTWLEELIGLAEAGGDGLELAKEIYAKALENVDAMCEPYASVIDIDSDKLPTAEAVAGWSGDQYANALRHVQEHPEFNQHFRQLLHIAFKLAAKEGIRYTDLLKANAEVVGKNVTENLYDRHFKRLFVA